MPKSGFGNLVPDSRYPACHAFTVRDQSYLGGIGGNPLELSIARLPPTSSYRVYVRAVYAHVHTSSAVRLIPVYSIVLTVVRDERSCSVRVLTMRGT